MRFAERWSSWRTPLIVSGAMLVALYAIAAVDRDVARWLAIAGLLAVATALLPWRKRKR